MRIELVYFTGCPHAEVARDRLREALVSIQCADRWEEWDTDKADVPAHLLGYSSPTVLVNGIDVERKPQIRGAGCAMSGGPSIEALRDALMAARRDVSNNVPD